MSTLLFSRGEMPDTYSSQFYNLTLRATDPRDQSYTDLLIIAQLPAPVPTTRYPLSTSDLTAPLATQQARTVNKWFADTYPPQRFYYYGDVSGKRDVSNSI